MTAIDDTDDMLPDTHFERVEALSRATTRLHFHPYSRTGAVNIHAGCYRSRLPTLGGLADHLGLRTAWSRRLWRFLGIAKLVEVRTTVWLRVAAALVMAAVALLATPVGLRVIAVSVAGAIIWAIYHTIRERLGGAQANEPFQWPRLFVWTTVCAAMIPAGGLIGLAVNRRPGNLESI